MNATRTPTLLLGLVLAMSATAAFSAGDFDPKTEKTLIEIFRENPDAIPLEPRDPSRDPLAARRSVEDRQGNREPGVINLQQTIGGTAFVGIPTFFKAPVALTPADLKAGKVDIAIMGAAVDLSSGMRGTAYAPRSGMRRGARVRCSRWLIPSRATSIRCRNSISSTMATRQSTLIPWSAKCSRSTRWSRRSPRPA